jgi:hypothetical protein
MQMTDGFIRGEALGVRMARECIASGMLGDIKERHGGWRRPCARRCRRAVQTLGRSPHEAVEPANYSRLRLRFRGLGR